MVFQRDDSSMRWNNTDSGRHLSGSFVPVTGESGLWDVLLRLVFSSGWRNWDAGLDFGFGYEKGFPEITGNPDCGAKGIRTPDPLHAMEMRYQLRHSPVELAGFEPATLCLQSRCATSCAIAP